MRHFLILTSLLFTMLAAPAHATFKVELIGIAGFPAGGSTSQVLKKASGTDYDSAWADEFVKAVGAVGASPSANGMTVTSGTLVLQPVDGTHPGVVTTGTQTIAGAKTFSTSVTSPVMAPTTMKIVIQASDPGTPAEGWLYFNSVSHKLKYYDGTTWQSVTHD